MHVYKIEMYPQNDIHELADVLSRLHQEFEVGVVVDYLVVTGDAKI